MTISSLESSLDSRKFSFASPVPESLRQNESNEATTSIILSNKKGEIEQEENGSFDSLPQALQEEEIQDSNIEEALRSDSSDDSNSNDTESDDNDSERTTEKERKNAHKLYDELLCHGSPRVKRFLKKCDLSYQNITLE